MHCLKCIAQLHRFVLHESHKDSCIKYDTLGTKRLQLQEPDNHRR